jgi:hypothetical protein
MSGMARTAEPSAEQPITRTVVSDVRLPAVKPTDRVQVREIRLLPSAPVGAHVEDGATFLAWFLLSPGQEPTLTPLT